MLEIKNLCKTFGSGDGAKPASLSTVTELSKAKNDVLDGATVTEKRQIRGQIKDNP